MAKKWLSITLACALSFSLLSGCGGAKKPEGKAGDANASTQAKTSEPLVKIPNLNGATIKILTQGGNVMPTGGTQIGDLSVKWFEEVQKKYNCKFEITKETGDFMAKVTAAVMANDKLADFYWMQTDASTTAAIQGLTQPWDGKIDLKNPKLRMNESKDLAPAAMYNGKVYQISFDPVRSTDVLFFNKTIFKKYGIEMPYELVKKKEWNWENFRKIAKKATIDTNNDGQIDIWGVSNLGFSDRVAGFFFSNKAPLAKMGASSKIETNIGDPNYIETLEFLRTMAQVDKSMEPSDKNPAWDAGAKLFKAGKCAMTPYMAMSKGIKDGFTDEFGIVPFPMGPKATNYTGGAIFMTGYSIAANADNIDNKAIVLVDWLQNNPYVTTETYDKLRYDEIAQYAYDLDTVDMFKVMDKQDMIFDFTRFLAKAPNYYETAFVVLSGKKTAATVVEEQKPLFQAEIDKLYAAAKK